MSKITPRTVNEIFDRYIKDVLPDHAPRTQREYGKNITELRKYFGSKIASNLVPDDFQEFMNVSSGKQYRNKMLGTFSSVLSVAVRDWKWLEYNVCPYVKRHESKSHVRDVSDEDIEGVLSTASKSVQHYIRLVLLTGRSQSDLISLKWSQIHEKEILFRDKGKKVSVPINSALRAVLDDCKKSSGSSAYVITTSSPGQPIDRYTDDGFRALWQYTMRARVATGHNRFTYYDLRARALEQLSQQQTTIAGDGAFIGAGDVLDAYTAIGKVLATAKVDVLVVDPYMDEKMVTEFAPFVGRGVSIRLLSDSQTSKPTLAPAAKRWVTQYGPSHPLELRLAAPRSLHDRLIVIDEQDAWILTQSLNAFASRSPASIVRVDRQIASMKIGAYVGLWLGAQSI